MQKHIKLIFSIIIALTILLSTFAFNVSAASMSANGGNYEVGQKVSISVAYEGDAPLVSVLVVASYDAKILRFDNVSGIKAEDVNVTGGSIRFIDESFSGGSKKSSYRLNFTAIAAGNTNVNISATGSDGTGEFPASKVAKISVTTPKPSSNANLSSIKLSAGSLSPAFNANTTNYNVTVKYSVEEINITGSVADGKSRVAGGGTQGLNVGNNECVLTVTAEDGTKKSYVINVKRMTEQETADAEQAARDANPLLVIIDNTDYTIVNSFEGITIPAGFTQGTATRKDAEIAVLNDEHGQYQLYWLTDAQGENGAFYTRDGNDKFTRISCINVSGKMYIIEDPDVEGYIPDGFNKSKRTVDGVEIEVYEYIESKLSDFYIVKCYIGGNRGYYRFDTVEQTMQRAADFDLAVINTNSESVESKPEGKFAWFKNMNKIGKALFIMIVFVAVMLVALAVILIVRIASSKDMDFEDEFVSMADNDFVLNDVAQEDSIDNKPQLIDDTDSLFESEENIIMQDENTEE